MKNDAELPVKYAETEAARSRAQFMATLEEIRYRVDPRVIAAETKDNIVGRANRLFETTTTAVRDRPMLAIAGLLAFAAAVGVRIWFSRANADNDAT